MSFVEQRTFNWWFAVRPFKCNVRLDNFFSFKPLLGESVRCLKSGVEECNEILTRNSSHSLKGDYHCAVC